MTPFAREVLAIAISNCNNKADEKLMVKDFSKLVCFDFSQVEDLLAETASLLTEESERISGAAETNPYCHGGLMFMPHKEAWFEIRLSEKKGKVGFIITEVEDQIAIKIFAKFDKMFVCNKFYFELSDNDTYRVRADNRFKAPNNSELILGRHTLCYLASCFYILNAPYGIKRETPPRHKGHVREAKRQGFELLPHHIITLDKSAPPKEYGTGVGGGSPKAFHFVRAHRRLVNWVEQRYTTVKAHWRGDPRLGIHRASYRVK